MDLRDDGVSIFIERLTAPAYFRIKVAVGTETAAEGNVKVDHGLSEQEFGLAEESLGGVGLDRVDSGLVGRDVVEVDAQIHFLTFVIDLT